MWQYEDSWGVIETTRRIHKVTVSPMRMDSRARDIHWTEKTGLRGKIWFQDPKMPV